MPVVITIVTAISILVGSLIASSNIKKNGLTNGALVGLVYIVAIYLLSSIIGKNFALIKKELYISTTTDEQRKNILLKTLNNKITYFKRVYHMKK